MIGRPVVFGLRKVKTLTRDIKSRKTKVEEIKQKLGGVTVGQGKKERLG